MALSRVRALLACLLALAGSGCMTLAHKPDLEAGLIAMQARDTTVDCTRADACAAPSPLRELGGRAYAQSREDAPRHYATILDHGPQSLQARIDLIRGARRTIDLQTYIFDEDDAAQLVLDELLAAAYRGVRVRVLIDQLSALKEVETLAALASAHRNFELRVYNPVLGRARLSYPMYALAAACCWRQLNRRMHNKLLLVDNVVGITGGRNYQNDYYDWDEAYNFRDRDLMIAGPVTRDMRESFDAFWDAPPSVPAEHLRDVGAWLRTRGAPAVPHHPYVRPERVRALLDQVADRAGMRERFVDAAHTVGEASFIWDRPDKHDDQARSDRDHGGELASDALYRLIHSAREEVLLQTPYLVISKPAQHLFRQLQDRPEPPQVIVSTSSLASSDSFITYAVAHKYKRRYLRDFGFQIHEYMPFPADAPIDTGPTGMDLAHLEARNGTTPPDAAEDGMVAAPVSESNRFRFRQGRGAPVRLKRAGMRVGMHAKSLVVDGHTGVVGTHNFDPRGDNYNTETAVIIPHRGFAQALAASIRRDIAPGNSWVVGRRDRSPVLPGVEYTLAKLSERMPIFDLWPARYATLYRFTPGPGCTGRVSPFDPRFRECHEPVGDFPEVDLGLKWLGVRTFMAFGGGLAPIL